MITLQARGRGATLILEHCAAFDRLDEARTPAAERLELELGDDLTRLLVSALSRPGAERRPRPL